MSKSIILLLGIIVLVSGCTSTGQVASQQPKQGRDITIANWNLQIFGTAKASNDELMQLYADKINDYDIVFVQEIRDSSNTSFPRLCSLLAGYQCNISSRAGRTSSKEQYGVIYRDGIRIVGWQDFNPDDQDRWERPPIEVTFAVGNYTLSVYNIHTKPADVFQELAFLEGAVNNSGNVMILGDLNADCNYYNRTSEPTFAAWHWIIPDDANTNVASTDCAYDRFILNDDAFQEYASYGIVTDRIDSSVSDHYLVWSMLSA